MKIGKHLTLADCMKSATATKKGIINTPTPQDVTRIMYVVEKIYDPLCDKFGLKIPFNSFFRCLELNRAVGSKDNSHHRFGSAIDIDCDGIKGVTNREVYDYIRDNMDFTELIFEGGTEQDPAWVHVAIVKGREKEKRVKRL